MTAQDGAVFGGTVGGRIEFDGQPALPGDLIEVGFDSGEVDSAFAAELEEEGVFHGIVAIDSLFGAAAVASVDVFEVELDDAMAEGLGQPQGVDAGHGDVAGIE